MKHNMKRVAADVMKERVDCTCLCLQGDKMSSMTVKYLVRSRRNFSAFLYYFFLLSAVYVSPVLCSALNTHLRRYLNGVFSSAGLPFA